MAGCSGGDEGGADTALDGDVSSGDATGTDAGDAGDTEDDAGMGDASEDAPPADVPGDGPDAVDAGPDTPDDSRPDVPDAETDLETDGGPPACNACHGNDDGPAPPFDLSGSSDTTNVGVGAHQSHLTESDWHAAIVCDDCHVVPEDFYDEGHADDDLPAELVFSDLSTPAGGDTPVWEAPTCSGVYCHGASLIPGGSNTAPTWTEVDAGEADCGTCHGLPPDAPHPDSDECAGCHPTMASRFVFAEPERHIDGIVDVTGGRCGGCHGSEANAAPPLDLSGSDDTSARGVGAHQSHLGTSDWHAEVTCDSCHLVPADLADEGHLDTDLPAELTWGGVAVADDAVPEWDGTTCAGVYCHGGTLEAGGTDIEPTWTDVGTGEAACDTCHGMPPATGTHPDIAACGACHNTVDDAGDVAVPAQHIDGTVDFR